MKRMRSVSDCTPDYGRCTHHLRLSSGPFLFHADVCSCCVGNSGAFAVVAADLQAIALAQAQTAQSVLGTVSNCLGGPGSSLLSAAYGFASGFAQDVQVAILK